MDLRWSQSRGHVWRLKFKKHKRHLTKVLFISSIECERGKVDANWQWKIIFFASPALYLSLKPDAKRWMNFDRLVWSLWMVDVRIMPKIVLLCQWLVYFTSNFQLPTQLLKRISKEVKLDRNVFGHEHHFSLFSILVADFTLFVFLFHVYLKLLYKLFHIANWLIESSSYKWNKRKQSIKNYFHFV